MKNNLSSYRKKLIVLVVVVSALLLGCLYPITEVTQSLITTSPQSQTITTPTLQYTATATHTPLPTNTRRPTVTNAPTYTLTPTQTDLPTLQSGDINSMIAALHSRCELPCWGNIIPGKTSKDATQRLLSQLGEWQTNSVSFDYNNSSTTIGFTFKHSFVDSIHLYPVLTKPYHINRIFTNYGQPEVARLEVLPLTADLTTWFNLILFYPRQGFFGIFSAEGTVMNSIINICPRNVSPDLYLLAANTYSLEQMNEIVSVVRPHIGFQPLDEVTEVDDDQFYEVFSGQSVNCIATKFEFQLP